MVVVGFRYYLRSNELESSVILAHSKEEAEEYLRTVVRNGVYKAQSLNIEHSYIIGYPTKFKVFAKNEDGTPKVLNWSDDSKNSGRLSMWTDLPEHFRSKIAS